MLPDAGRIQEEDARQANRYGYTKHKPAEPLFTEADALRALTQLQPFGYDRPIRSRRRRQRGVPARRPSARLGLRADARRRGGTILFGGDLGRYGRPVLPDPRAVEQADVLLVESTYGDRLHRPTTTASGSPR